LTFKGKIKNGKIIWDNQAEMINFVSTITDDTYVTVDIRINEDPRTNRQNKLWWAWMKIIGRELGYTKNEIHDILKYKFLLREEIIEGETQQYVKSTSTLTKKEFNKLTSDVHFWANDTLNINLPNE
jgi:hypothetical protein